MLKLINRDSVCASFLNIIFLVVISFLFIHLVAFLGTFLALAFPLWWLISPDSVPCLDCRIKKPGDYCRFCQQKITKDSPPTAKNFRSVIFNALIILIISLGSFMVVFIEGKLLDHFGVIPVEKTISLAIPSEGQYYVDEIFPMKVELSGIQQSINAVQIDFAFDPLLVEIIDITTNDSFATVFIQKQIDNDIGYGRLSGGLPNPGFSDQEGLFGTVWFRAKSPGLAKIDFLSSSLVLANDGQGNNLLKDIASISYLILPAQDNADQTGSDNLTINTNVLGAQNSQSSDQLNFFQETSQAAVLGDSDIAQIAKPSWGEKILSSWHQIVDFILSFWRGLFLPPQ